MTSSPGLLQHRNSASSTPKINLCREVLYPPPLGQALSLPTSPSVAGTEHGWKLRFSCSQAACPALAQGCRMEQGWFALPAPFVCCLLLDARSLGSPGNSVGSHTALPKLTLCQEVPKPLPDGWGVTPLCCLGALKAFSTQQWTAPIPRIPALPWKPPAFEISAWVSRISSCSPVMKRRTWWAAHPGTLLLDKDYKEMQEGSCSFEVKGAKRQVPSCDQV